MKLLTILKRKITNFKVIVWYQRTTYKININDGMYIYKLILWLISRRALRFIKRVLLRSRYVLVTPAFVFIIIISIFIPSGLIIKEYKSWYDVLWDIRIFFLTSFVIVLLNLNINEETRRRSALQKQHLTYSSFLFDSEEYISTLSELIDLPHVDRIFRMEEDLENFKVLLVEHSSLDAHVLIGKDTGNFDDPYLYMLSLHKGQISKLRDILNFINSTNMIEMHIDQILEWTSYKNKSIEEGGSILEQNSKNYSTEHLYGFIHETLTDHLYTIAELKRPWRWDHEINMEIRRLLYLRGEHTGDIDLNDNWL